MQGSLTFYSLQFVLLECTVKQLMLQMEDAKNVLKSTKTTKSLLGKFEKTKRKGNLVKPQQCLMTTENQVPDVVDMLGNPSKHTHIHTHTQGRQEKKGSNKTVVS